VLDSYLLRELAMPFALGTALFTFFLIIDRIYQLAELVLTKGVPFHLVLQLLVFMLPSFMAHTLPMALLVAVLLAGGRLAGDLEIVAFKAAGVSLLRLFRPVMFAALGVAAVTASLTLVLIPVANREFQQQLFKILQTRAVSALKERVFNTSFADIVVYVQDISASQVGLRGVIVSDERDPKLSRVITAREGRLLSDESTRRITLRLLNGGINEADVAPAAPPASIQPEGGVAGGAAGAKRYRFTAFSLYDMTLNVESPLRTATRLDKPERDLTIGELRQKIAELQHDTYGRLPFESELQKRFAFPVAALVFALLGFPLAVRSHRGGRSVAFVATLVILVAYYLVLTTMESMALRQRVPLIFAIWAPNLLFASAGVGLLVVTAREWRPPRLRVLWQALDRFWQRLPRRRAREDRQAGAGRDTTFIIDRYLLRQFLIFVLVGLAVASALFVIVDLLQTLDRYLRVKPPLIYIAEHFVYALPVALHKGLPIVMLVATIFLFLTLSHWHELTALKAAGVSLYRVSAPILLCGLAVSVGAGLFQEFVLPELNERGEEVDRVKIRGQLPRHLQVRTRMWLRSSDTRFYRVELLNPASNDLYGVTVFEVDADFRLLNRLDARQGRWSPEGWEFTDGTVREIDRDGNVTTVPFVHTAVELDETVKDFTDIQRRPAMMSYRELHDYIGKLEAAGFQTRKYLVDMYAKLSEPLGNLIVVLVAIPFALQAPRGGRLYGTGLAIGIMAAYLVLDRSARALGQADLLPPLLAAWSANIIFLGLGSALFLRSRT
jgi:LPS export ABC transporter permease LptG